MLDENDLWDIHIGNDNDNDNKNLSDTRAPYYCTVRLVMQTQHSNILCRFLDLKIAPVDNKFYRVDIDMCIPLCHINANIDADT